MPQVDLAAAISPEEKKMQQILRNASAVLISLLASSAAVAENGVTATSILVGQSAAFRFSRDRCGHD